MKNYPIWKLIFVFSVVFLSIFFTIPTFIYQEETNNWFLQNKINLGLDLQGGSYLLLEVESNVLIKEELENLSDFVRQVSRKEDSKISNIEIRENEILFYFVDLFKLEEIRKQLQCLSKIF